MENLVDFLWWFEEYVLHTSSSEDSLSDNDGTLLLSLSGVFSFSLEKEEAVFFVNPKQVVYTHTSSLDDSMLDDEKISSVDWDFFPEDETKVSSARFRRVGVENMLRCEIMTDAATAGQYHNMLTWLCHPRMQMNVCGVVLRPAIFTIVANSNIYPSDSTYLFLPMVNGHYILIPP